MKTSLVYPRISSAFVAVFAVLILVSGIADAQLPVTTINEQIVSPFAKVYEKVSPSVVLIDVSGEFEHQERRGTTPWPWLERRKSDTPNQPRPYSGMGSGVIIDKDGHILTNNHVIESPDQGVAEKIIVTLSNDEKYEAELIGRDPQTDLAIIKLILDGDKLPNNYIAELGDSDTLQPGDYSIAIGNPLGLESTITVGVISAIHRSNTLMRPRGASQLLYMDFIQTDAQINPGNSGGALADINGRIIGINNMYTSGNAGIGFAIPINLATKISDELIASGEIKRGFVGLAGKDISRDIQESMDLPTRDGILVDMVTEDFPADKAGIEHGDIITHVDGKQIKNYNDFRFLIADYNPGDKVKLNYIRDGEKKKLTLTLADRDEYMETAGMGTTTPGKKDNWRGITVVNVGQADSEDFDVEGIENGVVVVSIEKDSPAEDTSLEKGDVIIEINNKSVDNVKDFAAIKQKFQDSKKPILIYRVRKLPNGQKRNGFVAVKNK